MNFVLLTYNPKNTSREQEAIKLRRKTLAPVFPSQHKSILERKLCQKMHQNRTHRPDLSKLRKRERKRERCFRGCSAGTQATKDSAESLPQSSWLGLWCFSLCVSFFTMTFLMSLYGCFLPSRASEAGEQACTSSVRFTEGIQHCCAQSHSTESVQCLPPPDPGTHRIAEEVQCT